MVGLPWFEKIEDVSLDETDELLALQDGYCRNLRLETANFCHVRGLYAEHQQRWAEAAAFYQRAATQAVLGGDMAAERHYRAMEGLALRKEHDKSFRHMTIGEYNFSITNNTAEGACWKVTKVGGKNDSE